MITIEIPWEPIPWAAPRVTKFYTYDIREKDKRCIRYLVKEQYCGPLLDEPLSLMFFFGFSVPKSASKKKREKMLFKEIIPTCCDCTNLQKLFEDCLKGIVFKDDRWVETIYSTKFYAETPYMKAFIKTRSSEHEVRETCV